MDEVKTTANVDEEWEKRVLCSDESCIGIIGPDGRCKECGLPYQGPLPFLQDPGGESADGSDPAAAAEDEWSEDGDDGDAPGGDGEETDDIEWSRRKLCSDESCIGVIGADGCCKECGKPYEG